MKCEKCGTDTTDYMGGSPECANCWEVERRLDNYLRSEHGRKFVTEALERSLCSHTPEPVVGQRYWIRHGRLLGQVALVVSVRTDGRVLFRTRDGTFLVSSEQWLGMVG